MIWRGFGSAAKPQRVRAVPISTIRPDFSTPIPEKLYVRVVRVTLVVELDTTLFLAAMVPAAPGACTGHCNLQ